MRRTTSVLAALVALAVSAPAHATTCPLVTDAVGDAGPFTMALPVSVTPSVDIVSLDVASGPTTVVAVLRLADLTPLDPATKVFPTWVLTWRVDGVHFGVSLTRSYQTTGVSWYSAFYREFGPYNVPTPVVVDFANSTLTWTLPRTWFPELATPGVTLDRFFARAGDHFTSIADTAGSNSTTTVTWTDGTPGCVPAA